MAECGRGRPKGTGTTKNLTGFNVMDKEKAREIHSKGGKASAIAYRKRKALKEELIALLEEGDTQKSVSLALITKALNGDVRAFEVIRDTIGEKPTDKQEVKVVETDWFIEKNNGETT